ncbi:hypothetical protein EJ05DRAFT_479282 [Pseudovirgaria hyperparasitica]|uniref:Uncharacterized protein n=1 Tax=Pseudovirgaria hyperparasitica TaxID=470096 RepID=A0A6A6VXB9_9PEZI|nr:uncharacterized protein EJ05DRAFT_479282 [Pseudovirgaria hyperparasitica]KAF2754873.1 hypothetical protein EJ05DRAFT_479282 [Pseudovirgaria hyperparasitica]
MNTIRSVGYGWGVLILAGGGAYYFAKKEINADREVRAEADRKKRAFQDRMRSEEYRNRLSASEDSANANLEVSQDPALTRHAPEAMRQKTVEKSKYEPSEPWQSPKGNRFS